MLNESPSTILRTFKSHALDTPAIRLRQEIAGRLGIDAGLIASGKLFVVTNDEIAACLRELAAPVVGDAILHEIVVNGRLHKPQFQHCIIVARLPGVTDDEGRSAQRIFGEMLGQPLEHATQMVFSQEVWYFERQLTQEVLERIANEFLGNRLIQRFEIVSGVEPLIFVPNVELKSAQKVNVFDLERTDAALVTLSREQHWSLDLPELKAIQAYFKSEKVAAVRVAHGLPKQPTDCEMEILAQTWSEHCKHKEFAATIEFTHHGTGDYRTINGLFGTSECVKKPETVFSPV